MPSAQSGAWTSCIQGDPKDARFVETYFQKIGERTGTQIKIIGIAPQSPD
jgi:hypothetical protein